MGLAASVAVLARRPPRLPQPFRSEALRRAATVTVLVCWAAWPSVRRGLASIGGHIRRLTAWIGGHIRRLADRVGDPIKRYWYRDYYRWLDRRARTRIARRRRME